MLYLKKSTVKHCHYCYYLLGINDQGLYRVVGVSSKVQKLLTLMIGKWKSLPLWCATSAVVLSFWPTLNKTGSLQSKSSHFLAFASLKYHLGSFSCAHAWIRTSITFLDFLGSHFVFNLFSRNSCSVALVFCYFLCSLNAFWFPASPAETHRLSAPCSEWKQTQDTAILLSAYSPKPSSLPLML